MNFTTQTEGITLLLLFGIIMIGLVYKLGKSNKTTQSSFLVANRNVSWKHGALSIAVSWIWAPAIFIAGLQAYTKGIAGAFWFIIPNILCFFVFAPLAIRLRKLIPHGHTLPEYILKRFGGDKKSHWAFLIIFFGYQLGAIIINSLAGGLLLHTLTGINFSLSVIALSGIALTYSTLRGLEASILTDVIQMILILIVSLILVPWVILNAGGFEAILNGIGGSTGEFSNIFNAKIAFTFGIAMTLSLISGPFADQMFFQRSFAVKKKNILKTFIFGGLIFGIVPIVLSLLGFIAASSNMTITDPQMVSPLVIANFLPKTALLLFVFMAFASLASTLDSAYCAISALGSIDIYKKYINYNATDSNILNTSRIIMILMAILGTTIALFKPQLLWIFLIYGALASSALFPTIFSIYWKKLTKKGAFWAIILSLIFGLPISIYANITGNENLIVLSAILSVSIGLVICLIDGFLNKTQHYQFELDSDIVKETDYQKTN